MSRRGVQNHRMSAAEQREFDETDVAILELSDAGKTYTQICAELGVTPARISKVKKECTE